MLRARLSMSCWGVVAHTSYSVNRSYGIIAGGWWRADKHFQKMSHTCLIGFRSGDLAEQSMRWISSLSKSNVTSIVWWGVALSSMKMNWGSITHLKRRTWERRTSLQITLESPFRLQWLWSVRRIQPHYWYVQFLCCCHHRKRRIRWAEMNNTRRTGRRANQSPLTLGTVKSDIGLPVVHCMILRFLSLSIVYLFSPVGQNAYRPLQWLLLNKLC